MNGFNSFGQASSFGMPGSHGTDATPPPPSAPRPATMGPGAGFMHYSVDPHREVPVDSLIGSMSPAQIAQLASHAAEKYNQGLPLSEQEQKALHAYQAQANGAPSAEVAPAPAAPSLMERAAELATPRNIAIGVGALLLVSALSQRK